MFYYSNDTYNARRIGKTQKGFRNKKWVEGKINEIGSSQEGIRALRFGEGLAKELVEEALPLGIFCEQYFVTGGFVTVLHIIGNQNYDATIYDHRKSKAMLNYLEITQAHEGENKFLRMLKLEEEGHVNRLGAVRKSGTKRTGRRIKVEDEAIERSITFECEI